MFKNFLNFFLERLQYGLPSYFGSHGKIVYFIRKRMFHKGYVLIARTYTNASSYNIQLEGLYVDIEIGSFPDIISIRRYLDRIKL